MSGNQIKPADYTKKCEALLREWELRSCNRYLGKATPDGAECVLRDMVGRSEDAWLLYTHTDAAATEQPAANCDEQQLEGPAMMPLVLAYHVATDDYFCHCIVCYELIRFHFADDAAEAKVKMSVAAAADRRFDDLFELCAAVFAAGDPENPCPPDPNLIQAIMNQLKQTPRVALGAIAEHEASEDANSSAAEPQKT